MCYDSAKALERKDSVVASAGPLPLCHTALRDEALAGPEQPNQSLWSCMWHSLKQHIFIRSSIAFLMRSGSASYCARPVHFRALKQRMCGA